MDRRQKKTRNAIYKAFSELIQEKNYADITIQDIIDRADIGRSTFYAHFQTKNELLEDLCSQIFEHVVLDHSAREDTHDFSKAPDTLTEMLTHLLYHLKGQEQIVSGMLLSGSSEVFLRYLDGYLSDLFSGFIPENAAVPKEYLMDAAVHGFSRTVIWWAQHHMSETPEQMEQMFETAVPWLEFDAARSAK